MRVIIDTNVYIAGLISPHPDSATRQIVDAVFNRKLRPVFSPSTLAELQEVIERPKLERFFPKDEKERFKAFLGSSQTTYKPKQSITASPDPKDNMFLELALAADVKVIITGDKAGLLDLHPWNGVQIHTARDFVTLFPEGETVGVPTPNAITVAALEEDDAEIAAQTLEQIIDEYGS